MRPATQFVYDWLSAHIKFYGFLDVAYDSRTVVEEEVFCENVCTLYFHGVGPRCSAGLKLRSHYEVDELAAYRALIELGSDLGIKHNVSDEMIMLATGARSAMALLLEQT